MDEARTIRVERRSYSRSPWRLIDSQTGCEVVAETRVFDHPEVGPMPLGVPGYATKAAAVEALGRVAARTPDLADEVVALRAGVRAYLRSLACCDECYDLGKRSYLDDDARQLARLVDDL